MRKLFLIVILIAVPFCLFSEKKVWKDPNAKELFPMDANGKIVFTEVVDMPGMTKDALYSRAYEWFAKTFNSAQNVIQMQDKESGKLLGKALLEVTIKSLGRRPAGVVHYTMAVYVKDGRYKYELTDLLHDRAGVVYDIGSGGDLSQDKPACGKKLVRGMTAGQWRTIREQAAAVAAQLVADLKAFMAGQAAEENW